MNNFYQKKCEQQSALQIIQKERSETVLVNAAAYFLHPQKGGAKINDQMLKNLFKKTGYEYPCEEKIGKLLCVKTEYPCGKDKKKPLRIDLVMEFENICVGIEAKVDFKNLDNNLPAYSEALNSRKRERECKKFILLKTENADRVEEVAKKDGWDIINWSELTKNATYIPDGTAVGENDIFSDLLKSLKGIETMPENLDYDGEISKLDRYLQDLNQNLDSRIINEKTKKWRFREWKGDLGIRQVIEPRLVIEKPGRKGYTLDVCIGIRGLQFVIFKRGLYCEKLYEMMNDNFSYYYWQDYQDHYPLFDRYVICERELNGPKFPENVKSVERMDSVVVKYSDNWKESAIRHIEKILKLLDGL